MKSLSSKIAYKIQCRMIKRPATRRLYQGYRSILSMIRLGHVDKNLSWLLRQRLLSIACIHRIYVCCLGFQYLSPQGRVWAILKTAFWVAILPFFWLFLILSVLGRVLSSFDDNGFASDPLYGDCPGNVFHQNDESF